MKNNKLVLYLLGIFVLFGFSCKKEQKTVLKDPIVLVDSSGGRITGSYNITVWGGDYCGIRQEYNMGFWYHTDAKSTSCEVGNLRINEHKFNFQYNNYPHYLYSSPISKSDTSKKDLWGGEQEFEMDGNPEFGFLPSKIKFNSPKIIKVFSPEPVDTDYFYLFPSSKDYPITWTPDSNCKEVQIGIYVYGPYENGDYPYIASYSYTQQDNGSYIVTSKFLKDFPYGSLFYLDVLRKGEVKIARQHFSKISFAFDSKSGLFFLNR